MNCKQCGNAEFNEKGTCLRCGAPNMAAATEQVGGWGDLLGAAALIGVCWLGHKLVKTAADSQAATPLDLPPEFQNRRSRLCSEIPGQPAASDMLGLQREMERRQHQAEIGRMLLDHARTMNKIALGMKS